MKKAVFAVLVFASLLPACTRGGVEMSAVFADIGDLVNRAGVQYADVKIGTVTSIELQGYRARVNMRIEPFTTIPENAWAFVRSTSLLGEKFVEIAPPPDAAPLGQLKSGMTIPLQRTSKRAELQEVLTSLGAILQDGGVADLAAFIHSQAEIVKGKEDALGQVFHELSTLTGTVAGRTPEITTAIENLDIAIGALAAKGDLLGESIASGAESAGILAAQQKDLDRLISALDRFSAVAARYSHETFDESDKSIKDIRLILDEAMKTTGDLDKSLSALAHFMDLWPRVIPSDYVQLDVTIANTNEKPTSASTANGRPKTKRGPGVRSLQDLIWRAAV